MKQGDSHNAQDQRRKWPRKYLVGGNDQKCVASVILFIIVLCMIKLLYTSSSKMHRKVHVAFDESSAVLGAPKHTSTFGLP